MDVADLLEASGPGTDVTLVAADADVTLLRRWLHGPRVDEPLEVESYAGTTAPGSGSVRSLLANRLGSIALAVSVATGAVASEVEYDSFGQRTFVTGAEADAPRYGYTGREHDAESGLIYYRARHYDPALGQFLQQDPIGFAARDLDICSSANQ